MTRAWTAEMAYFSGLTRFAELRRARSGAILRFGRIGAARRGALRSGALTPQRLNAVLRALRRRDVAIVSLDDIVAQGSEADRAAVALTFDQADSLFATQIKPILAHYDVPFAIYVPTAFPDGMGRAWWLALEQVIVGHDRISLLMGQSERHFLADTRTTKLQLFETLFAWMRELPPRDQTIAIEDLCRRYSVDLVDLSRRAWIGWEEIATLARDPRATIGSTTVNFPALATLDDGEATREVRMGRAVLEAALGRAVTHFALPFGTSGTFGARDVRLATEAGFETVTSAVPGLLPPAGIRDATALPRPTVDGRSSSLRALRGVLSGVVTAKVLPSSV